MYICICRGITEKQIQEAVISRNSNNPKEIFKALGLGLDCGTCIEDAIKSCIEQNSRSPVEMKDSSNNT